MAEATENLPSWAEIADLVGRLDAGEYADVDLSMPGLRLRMSTTPNAFAERQPAAPAPQQVASEPQQPAPAPQEASSPSAPAPPAASRHLVEVTAPMLGTFYSKPSPDAPSFVEVGRTISADTTVGIVEVMKLMNPVTAGVTGRIAEIVVNDGELVEYGQVLFRVEPDGAAP